MTKIINGALYAYGILCIGMGVEAFIAKKSVMSLIGGGAIGVLMIASIFVWQKNARAGRIMSLVVALAGMGRFVKPFISEGIIYPAGVMVIASLLVIGLLISGHLSAMKNRQSVQQ